ncbi:MAG: hypothetical protein IJX55_06680 [Clostridia bacterium]|nr:hypothetical protein [Clostridia bacterium]
MDGDFSEKLGAMLSDPAMLAKIAGIAGSLGLGGAPSAAPAQPPPPKEEAKACDACPAKELLPCGGAECPFPGKGGALSGAAKNISQIRALLVALKPYLSAERCERIDKILGMMKIAEIMGYLK